MSFRRWGQHYAVRHTACRICEGEAEAQARRCQKVKMGAAGTPTAESQDAKKLSNYAGPPVSLPKHSYWFDFWVFVIFDVLFFLFIYFVVP